MTDKEAISVKQMVNTIVNQALVSIFKKLKSQNEDDFGVIIREIGILKMIQMEAGIIDMEKAKKWLKCWMSLGYFRYNGKVGEIERCVSIDRPGEWFDEHIYKTRGGKS